MSSTAIGFSTLGKQIDQLTEIADGLITDAKVNASADIDGSKLKDSSIANAKLSEPATTDVLNQGKVFADDFNLGVVVAADEWSTTVSNGTVALTESMMSLNSAAGNGDYASAQTDRTWEVDELGTLTIEFRISSATAPTTKEGDLGIYIYGGNEDNFLKIEGDTTDGKVKLTIEDGGTQTQVTGKAADIKADQIWKVVMTATSCKIYVDGAELHEFTENIPSDDSLYVYFRCANSTGAPARTLKVEWLSVRTGADS